MRFPLLPLACAVATLTLACGGSDSEPDLEPRSGAWIFMGSEPVDDTCGADSLYTDPPGQFQLTNNGDGTFTVDDSENVFDCNLDDTKFNCPERAAGEIDVGGSFGLDAIAKYSISVTGSFASNIEMSGRQTVVIVCEGADCGTVETVSGITTPCGWSQDFTAVAK